MTSINNDNHQSHLKNVFIHKKMQRTSNLVIISNYDQVRCSLHLLMNENVFQISVICSEENSLNVSGVLITVTNVITFYEIPQASRAWG